VSIPDAVPLDEGDVEVHRSAGTLHVVLKNPRRRNALTWHMYDRLLSVCDEVAADETLRVVVLRGAGDAFAAGTDIRQFVDFRSGADGVAYERRIALVLSRLLGLRIPLVGVVTGPAVGAGLALAAVCDILVATPEASFGVPIARTLGNCIPAAVVARLQRRLGASRTMAMLLTARAMTASHAAADGFVSDVVPGPELDDAVSDLVRRITAGAPLTLAALKEIDRRLTGSEVADEDLLERCYGSADFREGVSAFLDHRKPQWEGR
jgi:enoyl-CoA hydratase/carnithine racemase